MHGNGTTHPPTCPYPHHPTQQTTAVVAGAGSLAALMTARWFYRTWQAMQRTARITGASPFTYYYRGGFETRMTRREAAMILGVREFARSEQIKDAHRRIMIANHPDRGGSPYLAMKVNEAKTVLESKSS